MTIWVALFRAINVGGKGLLPMKDLASVLEEAGCKSVRTYIQSGNAVFQSRESVPAKLSKKIRAAVKQRLDFEPEVMLLRPEDLKRVVESNPFPAAEAAPASLHVNFLAEAPPAPDLEALERLKSDHEQFLLAGKVFYLYAPDGIGRSKLAANVERLLGIPATGRNWRTVMKLLEMAEQTDQ